MMNRHLRFATLGLAIAAFCGNAILHAAANAPASSATGPVAVVPSGPGDAYGYSGTPITAATDTGTLVSASSSVEHATPPKDDVPAVASASREDGYSGAPIAAANDTGALVSVSTNAEHSMSSNGDAGGTPQRSASVSVRSLPYLGQISLRDIDFLKIGSPMYQLERITTLAQPHLDVTLFGGGLASEDYYLTDEGIQLEQSVTEGLGIVARATGYQLWIEKNATSPLAPSNKTVNRLNFGRFEGGFDLSPVEGFNFVLLGGHDIGDSDAYVIESDISAWFLLATDHPVNLFVAPVHDFQNHVTSSEIDLRVVAKQTTDWILLLGAGGSIYGGGFISGVEGQGGLIVGVYNRLYQIGADLQAGYGSPGGYGELNLYKTLSIPGI